MCLHYVTVTGPGNDPATPGGRRRTGTDHHYEPAKSDIFNCVTIFPSSAIVGDDWDYPDVRRAATEVARECGRTVHAEQNKCWTYSTISTTQNVIFKHAMGSGMHLSTAASGKFKMPNLKLQIVGETRAS